MTSIMFFEFKIWDKKIILFNKRSLKRIILRKRTTIDRFS